MSSSFSTEELKELLRAEGYRRLFIVTVDRSTIACCEEDLDRLDNMGILGFGFNLDRRKAIMWISKNGKYHIADSVDFEDYARRITHVSLGEKPFEEVLKSYECKADS